MEAWPAARPMNEQAEIFLRELISITIVGFLLLAVLLILISVSRKR